MASSIGARRERTIQISHDPRELRGSSIHYAALNHMRLSTTKSALFESRLSHANYLKLRFRISTAGLFKHHIIHFTIDHCNLFHCYTRGVWDASIHLSNRTTAHQAERCCFGHSITYTIQSRSRSSSSFTACDHFRSSSQETLSHFN